jgi:hypothetical protein
MMKCRFCDSKLISDATPTFNSCQCCGAIFHFDPKKNLYKIQFDVSLTNKDGIFVVSLYPLELTSTVVYYGINLRQELLNVNYLLKINPSNAVDKIRTMLAFS